MRVICLPRVVKGGAMEGRGGLRSVGGIVSRGWKKHESSGESSDRYSQIRLFFGLRADYDGIWCVM